MQCRGEALDYRVILTAAATAAAGCARITPAVRLLLNGHILHKRDKGDSCLDAAKFWKQVVDGLLPEYVPTASVPRGRPSGKPLPNRLSERHFPATYDNKKYKPDCEVCSDRSKGRHQCNTYCKQCELPMHAIGCFEQYHTLRDFRK